MRLVTGSAQTEGVEYAIMGLVILFVGVIAVAIVFNKCWGAAADQAGSDDAALSQDEDAFGKLIT